MKCVPVIGIAITILVSPLLSLAQEDVKEGLSGGTIVSLNHPVSGSGNNLPAAPKGDFSVTTTLDSIGNVPIGNRKTDSITVTNVGKTTLTISSVTSSNAQFVVAPVTASLLPGATRIFGITFAPTMLGAQMSLIVFRHSGPTTPDTVTAVGTGTIGVFSASSKSVALGFVVIGKAKPDSVRVTNAGTAPLVISNITSSNLSFSVNPTSATIQPGSASMVRITFTPMVSGAQTGNVVFVHNGLNSRDTIAVSGAGTAFSVNRRFVPLGKIPVGSNGRDSIFVTNAGTSTLSISSISSSNGGFSVNPTHASIVPTATATFSITFTPTNTAPQTGNLVFTHTASSSPDTVVVSGTGTGPLPGFSLNTKMVAFGVVPIGASKLDSVIVTDTGPGALAISGVASTSGAFTVNPTNITVQSGQEQAFHITFTPSISGVQSGNIIFTHNAAGSPDTVTVEGTGTVPGFSLDRKSASFGPVPVGALKLDSVTVTDRGTAPLVISSVVSSNGMFTVNPTNVTLQPAQTQTFLISFAPTNTTPQSGEVVFTHNAPGSPDTATVSGAGVQAGFALNRKTDSFGFVPVGGLKLDSVAVTDTGTAPLLITNVNSSNEFFTVNPTNVTIQPSQQHTFDIVFSPTNTVPQQGAIVFTHNATGSRDSVIVNGTGTLAALSLSRKSILFGYVTIGGEKTDSVSVTNTGTSPLVISSVTSNNGAFTVQPTAVTLQPGQVQTYRVTFTPLNVAFQTASIVFTHNAASSPDTVVVTGTGTLAVFAVNRRSVSFGEVRVGNTARDSVVVSNAGASTLVIINVSSSNGAFSVNPTSASIGVGSRAIFTVSFTPTNTTTQTGTVVFTHSALTSPDTILVSGTGSLAGFALDRRSIAFGFVQLGGNKVDSVTVTDQGTTPLVISSAASDNPMFAASPGAATIQPGLSKAFYITCTPQNTNPQTGNIVFVHNASTVHDTVTVSATGLAALSPPALLSPSNGSADQTVPLALSWTSVAGATGYWLEVATDPTFSTIVLSDPTLISNGRQVSGLPQNTQYYWRVGTRNTAGSGPFSSAWTLRTISSGSVSGTVSFTGQLSSVSYRMFGLPGVGSRTVGSILPGAQNVDWRILRDNGKDTTYPAYYEDLTAASVLRTGEGYWLLLKRDLSISRTDTLPPLATDGTYGITVRHGWNMISNPFTATVQRTAVIAANGLPAGTLFWEHSGSTTTSSGTTFDPFKGYYFFNESSTVTTLKFPYPFGSTVARIAAGPVTDWRIELVFDSDINTDRDNYIGIAPGVGSGRNELDQREPPLAFDEGSLYFLRPEWDATRPRFATDFREKLETGQTWDFEVWNPRTCMGKITLLGVEEIPAGYKVVLVNALNSSPVDMRRVSAYTYQTSATKMRFSLIIGTDDYVLGETSKLIPHTFALSQNYPNPFNPSTTISYTIPVGTDVRLEILSSMGQRVRLLDEGFRSPATYSVIWDGTNDRRESVSSGVYFCRLIAGGNLTKTRKLLLVR